MGSAALCWPAPVSAAELSFPLCPLPNFRDRLLHVVSVCVRGSHLLISIPLGKGKGVVGYFLLETNKPVHTQH